MSKFRHLKVGDQVTRVMGEGGPRIKMQVTEVKDQTIVCGAVQSDGRVMALGWEFDRDVGCEEDHELGWGKKFKVTGTYLVLDN